jgi:hypothetical protein
MRCWSALLFVLLITTTPGTADARQSQPSDRDALAHRIQEHFEILPLADGIGLRPRDRIEGVRLIEITDEAILVNGAPVTGAELRTRLGAEADAVLRLSYLGPEERRAIAESRPRQDAPLEAAAPPQIPAPDVAPVPPLPPEVPGRRSARASRRSSGDRVRVFGNVTIGDDESVTGQAVAVLGSVRVDGEVGDQVVAVMGSVHLGPHAIVHGDVVSVGGRIHRAEGAEIRGSVTEISLGGVTAGSNMPGMGGGWRGAPWRDQFGAFPRLIGTTFRVLLLVLLVAIAMLVARPLVEASAQRVTDNPVQATLVGIAAQILLIPALVLTTVVLAISIIGIPLLVLIPFALLVLVLLALAGFSGTAYAVGLWVRRRFNLAGAPPYADALIGVVVLLLPILLARVVALAGWPVGPIVFVLVLLGVLVEFVAWSSGFGAVLTNGFTRWQARRAARQPVPPPAMP